MNTIAILLEEEPHSREVLRNLLSQQGYATIFCPANLEELDYYLREHQERVRLILSSRSSAGGLDIPLSRMIIDKRFLDLAPFIITATFWLQVSMQKIKSRHSRIDHCLRKPFGEKQLISSLSIAHRNRALLRNTLVVVSKTLATSAAASVFASGAATHWKTVVPATSAEELESVINRLGFRVGGILLDTDLCNPDVLDWLNGFKKTLMGSMTPVTVMSRDAARIQDVRPYCDLFLESPETSDVLNWPMIISILSERLTHAWDAKRLSRMGRQALKAGKVRIAARAAREGLGLDDLRWEFLELAGDVAERKGNKRLAVERFGAALATNPCSPYSYIKLLDLSDGDRKDEIAVAAKAYCPAHPQVQELVTK